MRHTKDSSDSKEVVQTEGSCGTEAGQMLEAYLVSKGYEAPDCAVPLDVNDSVASNPALVSKDISALPEFQHQIKLAPDAVSVAVKTHQVPYAIKEKVAAAVRPLGEQGIWEKADKGDWVHPLITAAKRMGQYM